MRKERTIRENGAQLASLAVYLFKIQTQLAGRTRLMIYPAKLPERCRIYPNRTHIDCVRVSQTEENAPGEIRKSAPARSVCLVRLIEALWNGKEFGWQGGCKKYANTGVASQKAIANTRV